MGRRARRDALGLKSPPAAYYRYSPDRKGEHALALLATVRGFLHADAYAGFDKLYEPDPKTGRSRLLPVACWAHARRELFDEHVRTKSPIALQALEKIGAIFAIEREINGHSAEDRRAVRQVRSAPLLVDLKAYLETSLGRISRKSELAKAIRYSLNRWEALCRFTGDGRLEMSTDGADKRESSARRSGHGRSSGWLFLPRRHHSLIGLLSTPYVVGFPLADLLDPIVPTWSRLAILARSAGFERCFA
jgi:Transposase IS66 family